MSNLESFTMNQNISNLQAKEQDALVEQYLPYAKAIAQKIAKSVSGGIDFEDILCNARLGLLEAAKRFNSELSVDFKTFAYYRIRGAIYDGMRKTGWMPRALYAKLKKEQQEEEKSLIGTSYAHIESETGAHTQAGVAEEVRSLSGCYMMSLDGIADFEVEDTAARKKIEQKAEFQKIKEKMRNSIDELPEKERRLIKMYYFQNKTLQQIGDVLNLSKSWTCRLHSRALEILFRRLTHLNTLAH